jgi:hypothetical protein
MILPQMSGTEADHLPVIRIVCGCVSVQQMLPPAVRKLLAMHDKETANLNVSLCC